jgi:hypothetical protein
VVCPFLCSTDAPSGLALAAGHVIASNHSRIARLGLQVEAFVAHLNALLSLPFLTCASYFLLQFSSPLHLRPKALSSFVPLSSAERKLVLYG